jgi:hypothetical protein|tara:strand:- start:84 stop:356 length:273 start_codon:yes stop_codon:yes gene_type:complete
MGGEGSVESAVMSGEDSVAEGIGFFLPLGLIRLPLAMVYAASKVGRIVKGKLFVELNLFRKWAFLCGIGLSKNSHLGQNAIGFFGGINRY